MLRYLTELLESGSTFTVSANGFQDRGVLAVDATGIVVDDAPARTHRRPHCYPWSAITFLAVDVAQDLRS